MSSILDALRKVEEEKAAATRPASLELDGDTAKDELTGHGGALATVSLTPLRLLLAALLFGVVLVLVSVGVSILAVKSSTSSPPQSRPAGALHPTQPESFFAEEPDYEPEPTVETTEVDVPVPIPLSAAETTDASPVESPPSEGADASPAETPEPSPPMQLAAKPPHLAQAPAPPEPALAEQTPRPKPSTVVPPQPPAVAKGPPAPVRTVWQPPVTEVKRPAPAERTVQDISLLPILTMSDKERLGLGRLRINMIRVPNKHRPHGSAIVNLRAVYVGERIPGTRVKLIGVEMRGIAVEDESTGSQFYVPS